jgi:hypothetical protein
VGVLVWGLFMTQAWLPLNPDASPNMRWDLALHTMVSFLTNTNQQHYSGQAQLSYLSQMVGIVGLQVVTPMMGLALVVATLRALFGGREKPRRSHRHPANADVGNYWADVIRPCVRFMLPLCLLWSLLLTSQGVPSTLARRAGRPRRSTPARRWPSRRSRWARSRRWWRSSSWAPMAAAGTAPTARCRWRTRRRSRTCWKCWRSS